MASPQATVEYDFIEEPSEDFFCPVTFDLLREPHQTLCCGNHLSQEAVTRLKGQPCPICKKPDFGTLPDKFYIRRVNELKLYCPSKSLGCEWVGELGSLDRHLNGEGGCRYVLVACDFSHAGCRTKLPRELLQVHLSTNVEGHLSMVAEHLHQQQQMIIKLQNTVTEQQQQIKRLGFALSQVHMTSSDIVVTDFEQHKKAAGSWFGPPFYSHIGGYKMCLRVDADGYDIGKGTHVAVLVHLMRGEYDDQLKWPFRGDIMIQLLNQRRDEGHLERSAHFDDRTSDITAGRVVGRQRAPSGKGYQFIAHNELSTEGKEFLKNDCLKFRILKVVVKNF